MTHAVSQSRPRWKWAWLLIAAPVVGMVLVGAVLVGFVALWNSVGMTGMAEVKATEANMNLVEAAAKSYRISKGAWAPDEAALVGGGFIAPPVLDAWGHPLTYASPGPGGESYVIRSDGPDGVAGTADDLERRVP